MVSLLSISKAHNQAREQVKALRISQGLTQEGLANRAGVPLPSLLKFEQKGLISLEAFLKILMVLRKLEAFVSALEKPKKQFKSIDDVLEERSQQLRKHGWRR
ncbi:MAG: helix-turn-helix transcriptional regulator [Chloroflexi bacterium]|nr:helix-turn-helix transcriptional regulator [Chloroflexota bacterium]